MPPSSLDAPTPNYSFVQEHDDYETTYNVGLGALRQSVVLDMRHGYFSNDPLGLWLHTWVSYTLQAFNTKDGQKALADLTKKNGLTLDGTPLTNT